MQITLKYFLLVWIAFSSLVNAEVTLIATDTPWREGETIAHSEDMLHKVYRKFISKTPKGYLVQEFFSNHKKATSQFLLINEEDVTAFPQHYYDDDGDALFIQGPYERWYLNGQQERKGQYDKQGKRTGLWTSWYKNGEKRVEGYYLHGKLEGIWRHWKDNGLAALEIYYKDDMPEIILGKTVNGFDKKDQQPQNMPWIELYENSRLMSLGSFKDGKREGKWFYRDEQGRREATGNYKEGKKNGLWTTYWVNKKDQKRTEGNYQDGKRVGIWKMWDEEGNQTEESYNSN